MTATPPTSGPGAVEVREVDAARWPDFERLFESRGGPRWCWCRMWRRDADGRMPHDRAHMKEAMRQRIASGGRVGLLAYVDGEPAAWCSVAPRETFVGLGGVEEPGEDESSVWSLTCFYVRNAFRHRGLMDLSHRGGGAACPRARGEGHRGVPRPARRPELPLLRVRARVRGARVLGGRACGEAAARHAAVAGVSVRGSGRGTSWCALPGGR